MTVQESKLLITIDSRNAERNTRAVANELENLTVKGDKADAQMTEMSSSIKSLVGYMGGLLTINKAIAMADGYTQMAARIRNATSSAEEYDLVQNRVLATANTTYRSLGEAQEVYLSLSGGMKSLGKSTTQTLDLVDSLSFSFTHNATRTDQAQSAMDSLAKSMAKGKIDADAWISIVTGADNIIADMAKTTGKTEAEIRKLGAEGKASLEDLIQTLIATREQNEKLANNMENSLADGFTNLETAVTVYLGKANEATSATGMMAGGLGVLAENLDLVANTGAVLGIGYVTSALLAKGAAVKSGIADLIAKRAADQADAQSQVRLAGLEVQRTRQLTALAAQEVHLARLELNSALTRTERAAATMRLTQAEVALALAEKQKTTATLADTVAQNANNAARSRGAMLLGLVGGWTGVLTLGVTALAAGYMYFSNRAAEANKKLEEQGKVAEKTKGELLALKGVQLDVAKDDLAASFEDQNDKLNKLNLSFNGFIRTVKNANAGNKEVREISDQVHRGLMSQADAIERLNKLKLLTPEQKSQGLDLIKSYEEARVKAQQNADAQNTLGQKVILAGNAASNAVGKVNANTSAMYNNADAANAAADAQSNYISNLQKGAAQTIMTNKLIAKGWDIERAKMASQAAFENGGKVSAKDIQIIDMNIAANKKLQASEDAIANAKRETTKASKAALTQQKKEAKELERDTRQALEDAKSLIYDYTSEFTRIETDLKNEIEKINNSSLKSDSKTRMIADATAISEARKKLYAAELDFELNEYNLSESEKLSAQTNIKKLRIDSTKGLLANERKLKKDSTEKESAHELGLIQLAKEQRIFQMQQGLMHANAESEKYWELERIRITRSVQDLDERNRQLAIANALQGEEKRTNLNTAVQQWGSINAELTGTTDQFNLEKERFDRLDKSQELFDTELAMAGENYALKEQAYQAHVDRMSAIEDSYQVSAMQLQLSYGESITGSMADMFKSMGGEQSKGYKVMYAISRGFAASQAAVSLVTNIAKASEIGFPQNIPMIAGAIGQGAMIVSMLSGLKEPQGYATGGLFTGDGHVRGAGTSTSDSINAKLSDYEFVTKASSVKKIGIENMEYMNRTGELPIQRAYGELVTPQDTYRVGMGTVDAIKGRGNQSNSGTTVNVNHDPSLAVTTRDDGNGNIDVYVRKIVEDSWNQLSRPNSKQSKLMGQNFNAPRRR